MKFVIISLFLIIVVRYFTNLIKNILKYSATKEIREWEKKFNYTHIPIVAVTAYALNEEREKSLEIGCDQHISKPIMKENLMEVLNSI